jgi:hypothetical protein
MQFQAAMRCARRALAFAVVLIAWSVAIAPAADAAGGKQPTPTAGQQVHRSAPVHHAQWSAGPVLRWTGYWKPSGSQRVREVQRTLNHVGYHAGPVDGLFGPITERAVHRFQARHRLRVDGIVGKRTLRALRGAEHRSATRERRLAKPAPQSRPTPQTRPAPNAGRAPTGHPTPQPAPGPQAADRHAHHAPTLPVTAILMVLGLLGLATMWRGYAQTTAAIRRLQREQLAAAARAADQPAVHDQLGRVREPVGSGPTQGRSRGHG